MTFKALLAISVLTITALTLPHSALAQGNRTPDNDKMREKIEKFRSEMKNASGDAFMKRLDKEKAFKTQIQGITDEKKKKILERVESKLSSMSATRQNHMIEAHARLTNVYDNLVTKEDRLKDEGHDTATAAAYLVSAKQALDKAKEQIGTQSAEPYTIDLSDTSNLKGATKELMKKIKSDTQADRAVLKEAKEALRKASRALAFLEKSVKLEKGENNGPNATTSPTI